MDTPEVRQLSLSLFAEIKSTCVHISQLALLPGSDDKSEDLIYSLRELTEFLRKHKEKNELHPYTLSTKLADYIFFPLSNLLKWPSLDSQVIRSVLDIIAFLLNNSWADNIDEQLLDQLCPLVVFLCGGQSIQTSKTSEITTKDFAFKTSAVSCLKELMSCFPRLYFTNEESGPKRLSVLGDSTTLLLDVMCNLSPSLNQDENEIVMDILDTLETLYTTRVTAEQTSLVFPGLVSRIVNFSISTKNVQAKTIVKVLHTLQVFILKVFDDTGINILLVDNMATPETLSSLQTYLDEETEKQVPVPILILVDAAQHAHRTKLWVTATSKQLKLSLLALFKHLFFNASSRSRIAASTKVIDAIFDLVDALIKNCFRSLFSEVLQSGLDILSALIYAVTSESSQVLELELLRRAGDVYLQSDYENLKVLTQQIFVKANHLIYKQLPSIIVLLNEEKIGVCVTAVKVHLFVLQSLVDVIDSGQDSLLLLKKSILQTVSTQISLRDFSGEAPKKANKDDMLRLLSGTSAAEEQNVLDDIELPPHINASSLTKLKKDEESLKAIQKPSDLRHLIAYWSDESPDTEINLFGSVFSKNSEQYLKSLVTFIGLHSQLDLESLLDTIFENSTAVETTEDSMLKLTVTLWTANQFFQSAPVRDELNDFDINDFLVTDEENAVTENVDELGYVLLEQALELMDQVKQKQLDSTEIPNSRQAALSEMAFVTASQTIEILSKHLSKDDFQADFLMENLHQLLEALTFPKNSVAHLQARNTLNAIVHNYYDDSLEKLVVDNADYLIDSLSMSLSTASGLMPSLPGILLVTLKISGIQLLETNQLHDILSEIFIVIDSYHGYSALVENFFLVFEIVVEITNKLYGPVLADDTKVELESNASRYKPWGMSTRSQMLDLIDENQRIVDVFDGYDASQEYFKRKPGVPFGEQAGDSDDEDEVEDEQDEQPAAADEWKSPIPKNVYKLIQQIFTYGLQFLSHPSDKLKAQVLRTLAKAYPLMSSNYGILMPMLAQYWPLILVLTSGVSTVSDYLSTNGSLQLIAPSLELTKIIITEDAKHEAFMSKRFVEMWDFWKKKSPLFMKKESQKSKQQQVSTNVVSPLVSQLYASTLLAGLNIYEKIIPDLAAVEIGNALIALGIPEQTSINRDTQALIWVLKHAQKHIV